jgi:hypothetical protein
MHRAHRRDEAIKDEGHNELCPYNVIIINLISYAIQDITAKKYF